ncbi:MAG: molybdopterin molybdotransferase MoeA [Gordonia sp. (in: high G+C Gram-positive bacteria)]
MPRRPVATHREAVHAALSAFVGTVSVRSSAGLGRVAACDVRASVSLPVFDNSSMDGFAVRACDVTPGVPLPVTGRVYAGDGDVAELTPGTTVAIMTGAPLPAGADAVIPVEQSAECDGQVTFDAAPSRGAFVRPAGDDVRAGDLVVASGAVLAPRHLGALAAAGVAELDVFARPRIGVIATGSELVAPGEALRPGQIYESNSLLLASLAECNGADVTHVSVAGDGGDFADHLTAACEVSDLVITSGGISMGEREPVRQTLAGHGWFGPIAMQPGGPQGLAHWRDTPVVCVPGNPVSSLVSFEVLLRDVVGGVGRRPPAPAETARLTAGLTSMDGKTQFLRGRRRGDGAVDVVGGPGSHLAVTAADADVLIEIPETTTAMAAGEEVRLWPLTQ